MIELPPLLAAMQLSDTAFPIGAYSHSWGLETLVQDGVLDKASVVSSALRSLMEMTLAPLEGRACALAWLFARDGDQSGFAELNQTLTAMRWAAEPHDASVKMGDRLRRLSADAGLATKTLPAGEVHHSTAYGWLLQGLGVGQPTTVSFYLQSSAAMLVSACIRLVPLGHTDGQRILSQLRVLVPTLAESCCLVEDMAQLASFAPALEYACVRHEKLYSRLFQS